MSQPVTPQKLPLPLPASVFYGWVIVTIGSFANMVTATMNPVVFSVFIDPMREDLNLNLSGVAWAISLRMLTGGIELQRELQVPAALIVALNGVVVVFVVSSLRLKTKLQRWSEDARSRRGRE